jgi:hypothetical protein
LEEETYSPIKLLKESSSNSCEEAKQRFASLPQIGEVNKKTDHNRSLKLINELPRGKVFHGVPDQKVLMNTQALSKAICQTILELYHFCQCEMPGMETQAMIK